MNLLAAIVASVPQAPRTASSAAATHYHALYWLFMIAAVLVVVWLAARAVGAWLKDVDQAERLWRERREQDRKWAAWEERAAKHRLDAAHQQRDAANHKPGKKSD